MDPQQWQDDMMIWLQSDERTPDEIRKAAGELELMLGRVYYVRDHARWLVGEPSEFPAPPKPTIPVEL